MSRPSVRRWLRPLLGWYASSHVWALGDGCLLATLGRAMCRSVDGGRTWQTVHHLPRSSGPMGLLPTSVCAVDGRLFVGEYAFHEPEARVLVTDDRGRTWSTFYESPDYRHFHGLFYDPYGGHLWGTTGDADAESTIGRFEDGDYRAVGGGSQLWRTVDLAFTSSAVIWGMDCSYCHDVRLLRLDRDQVGTPTPRPVSLAGVENSVYYLESLEVDGRRWLAAATQAEVGLDSTAPPGASNTCGRTARVLVASAESSYRTWYELAAYERTETMGERLPGVPTASGYVFLEADPRLGFVINPFNMGPDHGEIEVVPPGGLHELGDGRHPPGVVSETP